MTGPISSNGTPVLQADLNNTDKSIEQEQPVTTPEPETPEAPPQPILSTEVTGPPPSVMQQLDTFVEDGYLNTRMPGYADGSARTLTDSVEAEYLDTDLDDYAESVVLNSTDGEVIVLNPDDDFIGNELEWNLPDGRRVVGIYSNYEQGYSSVEIYRNDETLEQVYSEPLGDGMYGHVAFYDASGEHVTQEFMNVEDDSSYDVGYAYDESGQVITEYHDMDAEREGFELVIQHDSETGTRTLTEYTDDDPERESVRVLVDLDLVADSSDRLRPTIEFIGENAENADGSFDEVRTYHFSQNGSAIVEIDKTGDGVSDAQAVINAEGTEEIEVDIPVTSDATEVSAESTPPATPDAE